MKKLCSFLIPTRGRPEELMRCLWSLASSASPNSFDVHLYIDDDDSATKAILPHAQGVVDLHWTFGPHMTRAGWNAMANLLAGKSEGTWKWFFTDDAFIEGKGWDTLLKAVPQDRCIVYAEHMKGASPPFNMTVLHEAEAWTHPTVPPECFPIPLQAAGDVWIIEEWLKRRGYKKALLPGITVNHQNVAPYW